VIIIGNATVSNRKGRELFSFSEWNNHSVERVVVVVDAGWRPQNMEERDERFSLVAHGGMGDGRG